jgi:hypothetical protein
MFLILFSIFLYITLCLVWTWLPVWIAAERRLRLFKLKKIKLERDGLHEQSPN